MKTLILSWPEQLIVILSGCVIKPAYMILSFILILLLMKNREKDLTLIKWGLITFLAGELFCAANFLLAGGESEIMEILHGQGMVGLWIFLPWGFYLLMDDRVIGFSNPEKRCAMTPLCRRCWKNQDAACAIGKILPYLGFALAVVSLMPLSAPMKPFKINMIVNGYPTVFSFPLLVLIFELRVYAVIGSLLLATSGFLHLKKASITNAVFFTGFGFMAYSLFRFILLACYDGIPHWMNFWEEITELMMIFLLAYFLYLFSKQLKITFL